MTDSGHFRSFDGGFSLVELMVVIAMVAILVGLAAPSFDNVIRRNRVDAATEAFRAGQAYTRSEALTRGTRVSMASNVGGFANGWRIFVDDSTLAPNCLLDAPSSEVLLRVQEAFAPNVSFVPGTSSTNAAGTCSAPTAGTPTLGTCLSYDANGVARGTNNALDPITFCVQDSSSPSSLYRRMTINASGQLFLQKAAS